MTRYQISNHAREDLEGIWQYIADDSPTTADAYLDRIFSRFRTLADHPGIGPRRNEVGQGIRSFPVGQYVIFYRSLEDAIEIVRVISGHRDLPLIFPAD